jgi:hypothetical protein
MSVRATSTSPDNSYYRKWSGRYFRPEVTPLGAGEGARKALLGPEDGRYAAQIMSPRALMRLMDQRSDLGNHG